MKEWIAKNLEAGTTILVEKSIGMDTRGLERYDVVTINAGSGEIARLDHPAEAGKKVFVLFPQFSYDGRKPSGKEVADRYNRVFAGIKVINEFGRRPLLVNYPVALPSGNPRLFLGQITSSNP